MLPRDARTEAIATLREAMSLYEDDWPEVPDPVVNECAHDGIDGVQFTYLATIDNPRDPREFQQALASYWGERGYDVVPAQAEGDTPRVGTIYNATIRKQDAPWISFSASNVKLGLYVDSQCAEGAPDDFRPSTW